MLRDPKIAFSFSLALTAIIVHYGVAETSIGGTIGKDRVLQLKDSPFAVVKNIRVLNNVTLTIEPGVTLYFENQSQLILDGTLIARGTPSQGILMSGGDKWWTWGGIVLTAQSAVRETTNATRFYRSSSVLAHVEIRNAGKSATSVVPAMQIALAAPRMHNVTIAFAFGTAIELVAVHGDVDFSDIVVRNASFYAIQGSCSRVFQCVDCVLEGNFAGGIAIDRIPLALDVPTSPSKVTDFSDRTGSSAASSYFVGDDGFWFSFNDSAKVLNRILYTSTGYGLSIDYARQRFSGGTAEIIDLVTGASPLAKLRWENSTDSLSSTFTTESNRLLLIYKPSGTAMTGDVLAFVARHPLDARTVSVVRTTINKDNSSWSAGDGLSLSGYVGSVTLTNLWVANHKNSGIALLGTGGHVRIADSVSAYFYSINYRSNPDRDYASRIGIDFKMRSFSVVVTGCRIVGYYHNGLYLVSKSQMSINVSGNVLTKGVDTTDSPLLVQKTVPAFPNFTSIGEQFTDGAVYVNNNTVEFSRSSGLDLEVTDQYGGTDHIEVVGNVISNGDVAFRFKQFTGSSSTMTLISDNTFVNHTTNWYTQWTASVYVSATTAASVTISRNFMTKNEGKYVLQVTSNVTFDPTKQSTMVVFVNNNTLIDNDVTDGWMGNTPNAVLQLGTTRYISCQYNVLANPKSRYELAVQTRASSSLDTIDVQYNYWGTTNQTRIQSRIYDFVDTNFVALASYFPYLLSPDPKNVSTESPLKIPFIYGGGQIGGHLDRELTVSAAGSPYDVVNDITVLSKGALIVEAGVTLHFPRDHGILVEGALVTNGTVNKPVVFTSAGKAYESSISARVANEIAQFHIDGTWRTLCATDLDDYPAVYILAALACSWLGYPNYNWWSSYWNPKDGDPIIVHSSCPKNASSPGDCKLTLGRYSAIYSGSCARVAHLDCHTADGGSTDNVWAGIRFNPNTGRVPAAKASTLTNTVLFGAGVWFQDRIPGVSRTLTSVPIDGVTLKNSVGSSSIESHSYEPSVLLSNFTIHQSLYRDGLHVSRLPYQQVKVDNVSVSGAQGSGLRVQQDSTSFEGQVTHFSVCSGRNLSLTDPSAVYFVGISEIDYEAHSRCRTTLQASEGDRIFVLFVSMTIYSADVIVLSDSDGSLVEQISGGTMTAVRGPYISKGETMSITLTTGRFSHAPGFLMYVTVVQKPLLSPSIFINNSRFTAVQRSGIDVVATDAVPFSVKNSRLDGCDNGIGVNCSGCHISIAQNKIFNCTSNGFILSETGNISLVSNVIQGCQKVGQMTALFPGVTTWSITQNKISSNGDGLAIEQSTAQLSVLHNTFESNSGNAIALSKRMQINAEISNNVFTDHGKGGGPLLVEGTAERLVIANNTFKENRGDEYVVQLTPYPFTSSPFILKNNLFDGNVVIAPESCSASAETMPAVVVVAGSNQVNIQNNSFVNPNSTFQLGIRSLVQSSTGPSINASKNFWATTNEQKIRDGIYDFNYCTRVALAEIFPYLSTPFGKPVSLNASSPLLSIYRPNNVLLGRVLNDTTIPSSSTPYTVIGDLSVMPGKTLTVESGVQLKFKSNVGLFVEGNFLLKGTPNRPVFMTNIEVPRKIKDGDIRLFSKDAKVTNIGMAQIYHDSEWRAVCAADDSSRTPLNYFLAHTICLQLGYIRSNEQNLIAGANIAGWLPGVVCSYYDHSLEACDNYRFNKTHCIFGALSVTCDGIPVPPSLPTCHWSGIQFAANLQSKSTMENGIVQNSGKVNDEQMAAGMRVIEQKVTLTNVTVSGSVRDGMEVTNGRDPVLVNVAAFENNGSGIRFVNTPTSRQENLVLTSNDGHGLEITAESELRPLWNIPVPESRIVDICSQRTVLTISPSEPVYIRYVQSAPFSYHCKMKMQTAVAENVLSIQTLALKFQSESASVQLDGTYLYREKKVQGSLHYVTSTKSVEVELQPDVLMYDYSPTGNYFFASVQSINPSSSRVHNISSGRLSSNNQTGLSIVASSSTADRSNVTISSATISNNSYSGFQITGSTSNTDVKAISAVTVERCRIENNNRNSKSSTLGNLAGISIVHDNVDVVIQNCGIAKNARHAVHLTFGKSYTIFNNRIEDNSGSDGYDDTVFLGYSDNDDTSASVWFNTFVRNRMYGILRVDRRKVQVIGNVFTQNTANYLINTVQSTPNYSAIEQRCLNNTLYKNSPTANGTCAVVAAAAADTANAQYYTNTFVNPDFQFEFCAAFNSRNGTISATHNWWGTANSSVAKGKLRDYSSNPTLAKVQIVPIKKASPMNTTVCSLLWSQHGKLCYSYVGAAADWKSAESFCQGIGGYLASSHFPSTDVFFRNLVPSPPPGLSNSGVWLGLYYSSSSGLWQWTDGTSFDHHILSNSYKSGNCAAMTVSNGKWIAEKCSNMKPFICASGRGAGPIKFSKLFYNASVSVGASIGVNVTIVKAVSDGPGVIYYSIIGGNPNGYFHVQKLDGAILVARKIDEKTHPHYSLVVKAENSENSKRQAVALVNITVTCSPLGQCPGTAKSGSSMGAIIGGVVGGIVLLVVVILVALVAKRRSRSKANWINFGRTESDASVDGAGDSRLI